MSSRVLRVSAARLIRNNDRWCWTWLTRAPLSGLLVGFAITPCLADTEDCLKRHSQAWCLLDLAGYSKGASEVSPKRAEEFLANLNASPRQDPKGPDVGFLAIAGLDAAKVTTPVFGIGRGVSVGMDLVGAFLVGPKPGERIQLFMVMPNSAVVDGNPAKTAEAIYVDALRKYLGAESAELVETPKTATFGATWVERHYLMKGGPRCAEQGCLATSGFFGTDSSKHLPQAIDADPSVTGDSRVYVWNRFYASAKPHARLASDEKKQQLIGPADYFAFIKLLPPWFYLYLPGDVSLLVSSDIIRPLAK